MARLGLRIGRTYKAGAFSSFGRFTTPGAVFRFMDVYAENGAAVLNPMTMRLEAHPSVTDWTIWFNEKVGQNNPGSFSVIRAGGFAEGVQSVGPWEFLFDQRGVEGDAVEAAQAAEQRQHFLRLQPTL